MALTLADVQAEGLAIREPFTVQTIVPVEKTVRGRKVTVEEQVIVPLTDMQSGDRVTFFKAADRSHLLKVRQVAESKHLTLMFMAPSPKQAEQGILGAVLEAM